MNGCGDGGAQAVIYSRNITARAARKASKKHQNGLLTDQMIELANRGGPRYRWAQPVDDALIERWLGGFGH